MTYLGDMDGGAVVYELAPYRERRLQRVRDRNLLRNLPDACALARKFAPIGASEDCVLGDACVELVRAAGRLDSELRRHPGEAGEESLVAELERRLRRPVAPVCTGGRDVEREAAREAVVSAIGRQPQVQELADYLECDVEAVATGLLQALVSDDPLLQVPLPSGTHIFPKIA